MWPPLFGRCRGTGYDITVIFWPPGAPPTLLSVPGRSWQTGRLGKQHVSSPQRWQKSPCGHPCDSPCTCYSCGTCKGLKSQLPLPGSLRGCEGHSLALRDCSTGTSQQGRTCAKCQGRGQVRLPEGENQAQLGPGTRAGVSPALR